MPDHGVLPGVRRIAVLRANGLGDALVAQPALAALRAAYPDASITLATSAPVAELLRGRPFPVDEVLEAPRVSGVRGEVGGPPDDPPEVVEEFCAAMRERGFDLAVQLHGGGANANPLLLRFGARVTAGSRADDAPALTRTIPWTSFQHDVLRWLEVVDLVGARPVTLRPELTVTGADRAAADAALSARSALSALSAPPALSGPLVVLHPGATDVSRQWPPERLGQVGRALAERRRACVAVIGGKGDLELGEQVRAGLGDTPVLDLVGTLDLNGLVGVLERADLLVGNDSGPRHIAEAVGTPTVGVFTRANLIDVSPLFRARHRVVVDRESRCAVCGDPYLGRSCGHEATVLAGVEVPEVLDAALALLP
ncbi:glycosyltransferase family 9 protein [Pseudonocardia sp. RS11V-5]|uniref:glycosyltransferase family 9 protein n=1 Tax=Pseudonocardia terrae TaxID=2905831 RepID=UPI001E2B4434|nr:glycosyltransferase family 9 protein [Pseudonocardia terrae]MCE3552222.1 glycosyltransferase family 9 protein [Pseudonocardia terrae]